MLAVTHAGLVTAGVAMVALPIIFFAIIVVASSLQVRKDRARRAATIAQQDWLASQYPRAQVRGIERNLDVKAK